jgi:hypothetical protein
VINLKIEFKETLKSTINSYFNNSKSKNRHFFLNNLSGPFSGLITSVLLLCLVLIASIIIHINFGLTLFIVEIGPWQSFINTSWQIHSGVLAISVTLVIFLVQAAGTSKSERINLLQEFSRRSWLFPTLYWGLFGIIGWGITATFALNTELADYAMTLLSFSLFNSLITILAIIYWYATILKVFDNRWKNKLFRELLNEKAINETRNFIISQLRNNLFLSFKHKYLKDTYFRSEKHHPQGFITVNSSKKGFINDINFKLFIDLISLLQNSEKIQILFSIEDYIEKNDEIFRISDTVNKRVVKDIEKTITLTRKKKETESFDLILDSFDTELNRAIRDHSITELKFFFFEYIAILEEVLSFEKKVGISTEGSFGFSPLRQINKRLSKHFKSAASTDNEDIALAISETIYKLLSLGYHEKNILLFKEGLTLYKYLYANSIKKTKFSSIIFDRCILLPYEIIYLHNNSETLEKNQFIKEILYFYNEIFYHSSFDFDEHKLETLFDALNKLENETKASNLSNLNFDFQFVLFNWAVWIIYRFEKNKINLQLFDLAVYHVKNHIPSRVDLYLLLNEILENKNVQEYFWEEWARNEEERNKTQLGVYVYSSDPMKEAIKTIAFYGLILNDGHLSSNISSFTRIIPYLEEIEIFAAKYIKNIKHLTFFGEENPSELLNSLICFNKKIITIEREREVSKIINSPISSECIHNLEDKLNQTYMVTKYMKFVRNYSKLNDFHINTDKEVLSYSSLRKKQIFLTPNPIIYNIDKLIIPVRKSMEIAFFSQIIKSCIEIPSVNDNIRDTVNTMLDFLVAKGENPKLILLPWGTKVHRELNGEDYLFNLDPERLNFGTYKGIPIVWLPETIGNKIIILNSSDLGEFELGYFGERQDSRRYISLYVKELDDIEIRSLTRKQKKTNKNFRDTEKIKEHFKQYVQVTMKIKYSYKVSNIVKGILSDLSK